MNHLIPSHLILENEAIKLISISPAHAPELALLSKDPSLWTYFPIILDTEDHIIQWIAQALIEENAGTRKQFAIYSKQNQQLCGSTGYLNISTHDKRLEIGWTWLGKAFQGTNINANCKYLLLEYAFEVLQFQRIELKADVLNLRSRRAIEKLGATQEGIFRSHMLMPGNRRRDTVYYSILAEEWPSIKPNLLH